VTASVGDAASAAGRVKFVSLKSREQREEAGAVQMDRYNMHSRGYSSLLRYFVLYCIVLYYNIYIHIYIYILILSSLFYSYLGFICIGLPTLE
jgi:hypothetical protein